jgi:hypothetical protein
MITLEKSLINKNILIASIDVSIPKNWGLSPQGNQSLTRKCKSFVRKLEKTVITKNSPKEHIRIFTLFYESYQKSLKTILYQTESPSLLNQKVLSFIEECVVSSNLDKSILTYIQ